VFTGGVLSTQPTVPEGGDYFLTLHCGSAGVMCRFCTSEAVTRPCLFLNNV